MVEVGENHPVSGPLSPVEQASWASKAFPLGVCWNGDDVTFAVYSGSATRILLEIYEQALGTDAKYDYWMEKGPTTGVWQAKLAKVPPGTLYAFRCFGPNWDFSPSWRRGNSSEGFVADVNDQGTRFNPNKVLFDPYARELSHDRSTLLEALKASNVDMGLFATGGRLVNGTASREYDTGRFCSKGLIISDGTSTGKRPRIPVEKTLIYEAHVRGLTQHPSASRLASLVGRYPGFDKVQDIPEKLRGTYAGVARMAEYLKALGFTTIELLPIHESDNDGNPTTEAGGNYWGYMTQGFFAPDRRYSSDKSPGGPTREFKEMVRAFHDAGLEVYLDVVYNHSGEGGNWNDRDRDTVGFSSLGGFDTAYYVQNTERILTDDATGCGNQLEFSFPAAQQLVLDSLMYWLKEMGIDGFRFDLAPVLGRENNNFEENHPLLLDIRDLAEKNAVEVIAEPWDTRDDKSGKFPAGWGEWNNEFRDCVRCFLKGDGNTLGFVRVVNGDYERFNDKGGPQRSINFVTVHDGFTLMDLVSYNTKNNDVPWPFGRSGNDSGAPNNNSWDSGGDHALRRQRLRNFWVILLFSRGVPLTSAGDELARTQNGNNNPYNIDSVGTWNNYDMLATNHPTAISTGGEGAYHDNFGTASCAPDKNPLFAFVTYLVRLRRDSVALRQRRYGDLVMDSGGDVTYLFKREDGTSDIFNSNRCVWLRIDGSAVGEDDFLLLINMYSESVTFSVPPAAQGHAWLRIIDTATWAESAFNCWSLKDAEEIRDGYRVQPFSIVVLTEAERQGQG